MKTYMISDYIKAGCPEMSDTIGIVLHGLTHGRICDTGCMKYNGGKCESFMKLTQKVKLKADGTIETVRDEAERRRVSIKQVRKERRDSQCQQ